MPVYLKSRELRVGDYVRPLVRLGGVVRPLLLYGPFRVAELRRDAVVVRFDRPPKFHTESTLTLYFAPRMADFINEDLMHDYRPDLVTSREYLFERLV